jgi:tetratricopeptide (TPR) repeat protein
VKTNIDRVENYMDNVRQLMEHAKYRLGGLSKAIAHFVTREAKIASVGSRVGKAGLVDPVAILKQFSADSSEISIPAFVWHGLGDAYLHLNHLDAAEEALNQANILDDENPEIWGSLCLLNLKKSVAPPGLFTKARQCLTQAINLGITNGWLLNLIGHEFL